MINEVVMSIIKKATAKNADNKDRDRRLCWQQES